MFGPSTSSNIFSITRSIGHDLAAGDEIVCTRLDHDSNISPWLHIAGDAGAVVKLADFDAETGRLAPEAVIDLFTHRTRWVAVTGASNAIGTAPDVKAITAAAHSAGARVVVDGVHLTPHLPVDIDDIGCDVFSTSSYKWYGPHAGITWIEPELLDRLYAYKVRPAPDRGPDRLQLGTPSYESIAAIDAAASFLIETGLDAIGSHERVVFDRLLRGLLDQQNVPRLRSMRPRRPCADPVVQRRRPQPARCRTGVRRRRGRCLGRPLLRDRGDRVVRPRPRHRRGPRRRSGLHRGRRRRPAPRGGRRSVITIVRPPITSAE